MAKSPRADADTTSTMKNSTSPIGLVHPTDTAIAALIFAVLGFLYYETTNFDEVSALFSQNVPPTMFPRILLFTIGAMALSLPFEHIMLAKKGKNIDKDRSQSLPSITWLTMLLLICILSLFEYTGMLITMFLVCLLMPRLWGEKRLVVTIAFSIGFPLIVAAVFSGILGVHFESGMFGFGI